MSTFFFYDLETTGVDSRSARIMQFAGQRTDLDLNPVGQPVNYLIKITDDILPEPDAILVTGITPQKTLEEGISESEFIKIFDKEVNLSGTIFVGFNSVRFDDEFMRFLFWRNYYDPYEWEWKNNNGRWDILDLTRITRALRPEGINWPFDPSGKPTNRLELITEVNKIDHTDAHDALSDVNATIAVARLIKQKQPKLFDFILNIRGKKSVNDFINKNNYFVYSSGKYPGEFEKTTVVANLGQHPEKSGYLVYDLRHDPADFINMTAEELAEIWRWKKDSKDLRLPVKSLQPNRCPALAPLSVLDKPSLDRIKIDLNNVKANYQKLENNSEFYNKLVKAIDILNKDREQSSLLTSEQNADSSLYEGFLPDSDRVFLPKIRSSKPDELSGYIEKLDDGRLKDILPLYKARNFPKYLSDEERASWEAYRKTALLSGGEKSRFAKFNKRLLELGDGQFRKLSDQDKYLLEELRLYADSIFPDS